MKNIAENCMNQVDKLIEDIKLNTQIEENNIISILINIDIFYVKLTNFGQLFNKCQN